MVKDIVQAIQQAELQSSGEIRVHVKAKCRQDVFKEATKIFRRLGMQRTRQRNAVLIFVALDSRKFAIVGDVGIHEKVGEAFWNEVRDSMAELFVRGNIKEAIVHGIIKAGEQLKRHFPRLTTDANELPNTLTEG